MSLVLTIVALAQTEAVIPELKELQRKLGFEPTRNFERRADGQRAFSRCYYTGTLELPDSYDRLGLRQGECEVDERKYDVFYYPAEAVANGSAPVTESLAQAPLERVLVVVPHEDFHESRAARRAPAPLDEAAATLAGFLTAAEFARRQYGESSETYQKLAREPDLFLRKAEIVNRYHGRLRKLYAAVRAGKVKPATALVEKTRAFIEAQRECEAILPEPAAFNRCFSANNNAGLAFDFTYTREYPRFFRLYEAQGRQVAPTLGALRRLE
jgi:hypothetical protein